MVKNFISKNQIEKKLIITLLRSNEEQKGVKANQTRQLVFPMTVGPGDFRDSIGLTMNERNFK